MLDNLLKGYKKPDDRIGENGKLKQSPKRGTAAELTEHVGYEKNDVSWNRTQNVTRRSSGNITIATRARETGGII